MSKGISLGLGDSRYAQLAGSSAISGNNTHAGSEAFNAQIVVGKQSFAATGTISDGGGSVVIFTGFGSQTISLPLTPSTNRLVFFRNQSTSSVALSGNGANIDGSASATVAANNGAAAYWFDGTAWWSLSFAPWLAQSISGAATFTGGATVSGNFTASAKFIRGMQALATTGGTVAISATGGSRVNATGSTAATTYTLPASSLSAGQEFVFVNKASVSVTLSGNGNNINNGGSTVSTLTVPAGAVRTVSWDTTSSTWDVISSVG